MSSKKTRNKPCPCGSGNKFKNCCLGLSPKEIDRKREARNGAAADYMKVFEENTRRKHEEGSTKLQEGIAAYLKNHSLKSLLFALGTASLLPQNQGKEMRLTTMAEIALCLPPSDSVGDEEGDSDSITQLYADFDTVLGSQYVMYEVDNLDIAYISWVNLEGEVYRTFSGSLSDSELFFSDSLEKIYNLAQYLPEPLKHTPRIIRELSELIDSFIQRTGLVAYESNVPGDFETETITISDEIRPLFTELSRSFAFKKAGLNAGLAAILNQLSKQPGAYSPEFQFAETEIYAYPVIDLGDEYIVPFPQLLLAGLIRTSYHIAAAQDEKTISEQFREHSLERIKKTLSQIFGTESTIGPILIDGKQWADFAVKFDGKLILVSVPTALEGEDINEIVDTHGNRLINGYHELEKDSTKRAGTSDKRYPFNDLIRHMEPIFLIIPDLASADLLIGSNLSAGDHLLQLIPYSHLRYLADHIPGPLRFIRFLRAIERLSSSGVRLVETNTLDLYGIFSSDEALQLRDVEQQPNVLFFDSTAGSRKVTEDIKEFRKQRIIANVEGKRSVLRKHWDNFYGIADDDVVHMYRQNSKPQVEMHAYLPTGGQEQSSSSYLVFDSLCYFLSQNFSSLETLFKPELHTIKVSFTINETATHEIEPSIAYNEDNSIANIAFSIAPNAYRLFSDGTNNGERTVITTFLSLFDPERKDEILNKIMPASDDRRFQVKSFRLAHPSYENAASPTSLSIGDNLWVDQVVSKAVLDAGAKPGDYSDPNDIGRLSEIIKQAALAELRKRVINYPKQELLVRSYAELESVYVADERKKLQLSASLETARYGNPLEEQIKDDQDYTQLGFANRFLLELTLQAEEEGEELLTDEAYLELLALASKVVDIDFWGDTMFYGLQTGVLNISKGGYPDLSSNSDRGRKLAELRLRASVRQQEMRTSALEKEESETEEAAGGIEKIFERLNPASKESWGFTLEERNLIEQELLNLFDDSKSPFILIHQNTLIDRLVSRTKLEKALVESILTILKLSSELLADKDISPSYRYWRDERLLNRPLVVVPANPKLLMFSRFVVERTVLSFYDRLLTGRLDYVKKKPNAAISKAAMELVNEAATEFEVKVINGVKGLGLRAERHILNLGGQVVPKEGVGEIDGIAWHPEKQKLYVIESKNNAPSRSPVEIKTEIDNYFGDDKKSGYYAQLERKLDWVKANPELVRKHFNIDPSINYEVEGILVSNSIVVASILKDAPFRTITLRDLPERLLSETAEKPNSNED